MIDRRRTLAWLATGAGTIVWADEPARIPAFSAAPAGIGVPAGWRHQTLPKVERTNEFAIVADEGRHVLQVRSRSSASSWVARVEATAVNVPFLQWSWKVSRSLAGSDLRTRQGDDYAARLYVLFDLPLDRLSLGDRLRIQASRALAGVDVPSAALCYVWGSAQPAGSSGRNPYTDRVRMIVVESGNTHANRWRTVSRDVRRDWHEAFGGPMPAIQGVAVGADTDNTGDSVETWFSDILLSGAP